MGDSRPRHARSSPHERIPGRACRIGRSASRRPVGGKHASNAHGTTDDVPQQGGHRTSRGNGAGADDDRASDPNQSSPRTAVDHCHKPLSLGYATDHDTNPSDRDATRPGPIGKTGHRNDPNRIDTSDCSCIDLPPLHPRGQHSDQRPPPPTNPASNLSDLTSCAPIRGS